MKREREGMICPLRQIVFLVSLFHPTRTFSLRRIRFPPPTHPSSYHGYPQSFHLHIIQWYKKSYKSIHFTPKGSQRWLTWSSSKKTSNDVYMNPYENRKTVQLNTSCDHHNIMNYHHIILKYHHNIMSYYHNITKYHQSIKLWTIIMNHHNTMNFIIT